MKIITTDKKENEEFLKTPTKEVDLKKEDVDELKELAREMRKAMHKADGVGLSANQVGINKKFFVAQIPDDQGKPKFYAIVNPEITQASKEKVVIEEGCLSIPGVFGPVERPSRITLKGRDVGGKKIKIKAWGALARVFQHEVDHLNGVLFTEKAKEIYKITPKDQESKN